MPVASSLANNPTVQVLQAYLNNPRLSNIKNIVFILFIYKILSFLNTTFVVHGASRTYNEIKVYLSAVSSLYAIIINMTIQRKRPKNSFDWCLTLIEIPDLSCFLLFDLPDWSRHH